MPSLTAPTSRDLARYSRWLAPFERALGLELRGLERIPRDTGPLMFVGNHQLLALDAPFLVSAIYRSCGVPLRALADDLLFTVPTMGRWAQRVGVVRASRANAHALLEQDAWILVYPGGAREATKPMAKPYELDWWDRLGFAEVALQHRATIVPIAAYGIDDAFRILVSNERIRASPIGGALNRLQVRSDLILPLFAPRRLPKLRFHVCEPITTADFRCRRTDTSPRRLRAAVAASIQDELARMGAPVAATCPAP